MDDQKYERIYTIGCFDWFHYGHQNLLERMRKRGKQIIVGIHDDHSFEQLKNLKPTDHENIKKRMTNVKKYADIVYVVPDKDPTFFLDCVIRNDDTKDNACFMRADDMPNFPGRNLIESKISLEFLEYTKGISSTEIRNKKKLTDN